MKLIYVFFVLFMLLVITACAGQNSSDSEAVPSLPAVNQPTPPLDDSPPTLTPPDSDEDDDGSQVTMCHFSKKHFGKMKTIHVKLKNVEKHLKHGDMLGSCE